MRDSLSLATLVSPQMPIMLESSAALAMSLFSESGDTVCGERDWYQYCTKPLGIVKHSHSIGINLEDVFVECRIDTNDVAHLMEDFKLKGTHWPIEMDPVEIVQKQDLGVSLSSITGFTSLGRLSNLDDDHVTAKRRRG